MNLSKLVSPKRVNRGLWWQRALNLISGCTGVSESCEECWSARQAHLQGARKKLTKYQKRLWQGLTTPGGRWTGEIRCLEENLGLPLRTRKPTLWSVWNDLGHPNVGSDFIFKALANMLRAPHHFFLILTKRPQRFVPYFDLKHPLAGDLWYIAKRNRGPEWPPPNIGLGVTVELSKYLGRIDDILQVPAALHFVSLEPLLGEISLCEHCKSQTPQMDGRNSKRHRYHPEFGGYGEECRMNKIDWVQLGCESGPRRRHAEPRWFEMVIRDCKQAGVPVFFKQQQRGGKVIHAPKLANGEPLLQFPEVKL